MPLHLPPDVAQITLDRDDRPVGYFPFGFIPFSEHQLGNGDYFGLYWPIGHEDREPIVAETFHDGGQVEPMYSSLARFLALAPTGEEEHDHPAAPSYAADPDSPLAGYQEARRLLKEENVEAAVTLLETVVLRMPEYTGALGLLAAQYRRLGRKKEACRMAVRAIVAPPSFGNVPDNLPHWLARQEVTPTGLIDDPVWLGRAELVLIPSGGTRHGGAYPALARAIETYIQQGRIESALILMQTYAEFMNGETRSFQERHGYDAGRWWQQQRELSGRLPHGPRFLA